MTLFGRGRVWTLIAALALMVFTACSANPPSTDVVPSSSTTSASSVAPRSTAPDATSTTAPPPAVATTEPPVVEQTQCVPPDGMRPEWDKDCDGLIDVDAPIGDVGCDTAECLIEQNRRGAEQAERGAPVTECAVGEVRNDGGGNYSTCVDSKWNRVTPTFDPNSADGYGPNQPLPPKCVRFPDQYQC